MEKINYHLKKVYIKLLVLFENFSTNYFYRILNNDLQEIIATNRDYLKSVGIFLEHEQFQKNDYGMDMRIYPHLDKKIKDYPTYSDLIVFISNYLKPVRINYLEIGVSVMKNYMQLENYFKNARLVAYDINPIVPKYKSKFSLLNFNKDSSSSIFNYESSNSCYYFQGSVLNDKHIQDFNNFFEDKFNLVFSDALHTTEGVKSEYDNIISKNLDENFILYFDDLDFPGLFDTANDIFNDLLRSDKKVYFNTFKIYGWVGQHEKMHKNGIISTVNFHKEFVKHNVNLPFKKSINPKK